MQSPSRIIPNVSNASSCKFHFLAFIINMDSMITCNVQATQYEVVRRVISEDLGWNLSFSENLESSDLIWSDQAISADTLSKMKLYQKINHFPGMHVITRKNYLAWTLSRMQKLLPEEYNFFPKTWVLPSDSAELRSMSRVRRPFIVKPAASCQGRGIYITTSVNDIKLKDNTVVQEYISNPLLLDGLKFDLRIYALITSVEPLNICLLYTSPSPRDS